MAMRDVGVCTFVFPTKYMLPALERELKVLFGV